MYTLRRLSYCNCIRLCFLLRILINSMTMRIHVYSSKTVWWWQKMFLGDCITLFHKNHQKSSFLMEHSPTLKSEPCLFFKPVWTVSCKLMGSQTFAHYLQTCSNHHATYNAPYQTNNQKPKYKLINFEGPSSLGQPVQPIILPQFANAKMYLILGSFLYII